MLGFDRTGAGPPLLLLHGTNSSRRIWRPILPALCRHREVLAVDLPAHGESPPSCCRSIGASVRSWAIETVRTAAASAHFPEHFRQTRMLRYRGGQEIPPSVPSKIVWGSNDHVARLRTSRHVDQLPAHATVETWDECGHMIMWDQPDRTIAAALELPT